MGTPASFNNPSYSSIPAAGTLGVSGGQLGASMPELPTPQQLAPDVMTAATAAPACQPTWPQCATGPTLHTHPIAVADPMAAIPSPQQIAPHVFFNYPANNPVAQQPAPPQPPAMPPQQRAPQPPPQQPPQPPPPQPKAPQPPPQPTPAPQPKAPIDEFDGALSDEVVKTLNRQLNDSDEVTRATAATDLSNILQKHPKLADHPAYKPYVDAFMEKIMADPSSLVRGMGEVIMQLGSVQNPSEAVKTHLKKLSKKDDTNLTKENDQASSILAGLENGTLGKDLINTSAKKDAKPGETNTAAGATPGAAAKGPAEQTPGANASAPPQAGATPGAAPQTPPADPNAAQPSAGAAPSAQGAQAAPSDPNSSATSRYPGVAGGAPPTPAPLPSDPTPPAGADPAAQMAQPAQQPAPQADAAPYAGAAPDPSAGMAGAAPAGYPPQPQMPGYPQQAQSPYAPAQMAAGPGFGSRLNLMSSAPNGYMPSWMMPQTGQRLNMYEGLAT